MNSIYVLFALYAVIIYSKNTFRSYSGYLQNLFADFFFDVKIVRMKLVIKKKKNNFPYILTITESLYLYIKFYC